MKSIQRHRYFLDFTLSSLLRRKWKNIRGIRDVKGRLWGYYFHQASGSNYTLMATGDFPIKEGETIIGDGVLRTWGTIRENQLFFKAYDGEPITLRIANSFSTDTDLVSSDLILMSESAFRRITGVPAVFATDLAVTIRNLKESPTIAEKVVALLPDTRPVLREDILRTYTSLFDWRSGYIIVLLSGAVLAFFIFVWDKATELSGEERSA